MVKGLLNRKLLPIANVIQVPPVHSYSSISTRQRPANLLGAMVKGFLTRKLFHSNKVQFTVTTIKVCHALVVGSYEG